jgi:hypothetical protein
MGRVRAAHLKQHLKQHPKPRRSFNYDAFTALDGSHPWQTDLPESCVMYNVRKLSQGKVAYFNFKLAIEMGLLPKSHPQKMNPELESILIDTFSLRIINEFDEKNNIRYHPSVLKPKKYMATRYLQLQHADKTGRTSGDGRSIWNGTVTHDGKTWDVSSRGTGVTCLAPGVVEAGEPLRSGGYRFGYGCGLADLDELLAAALSAEIFHNNGIATERVLCVIDLGRGAGIGVRAGLNLARPAHLFSYLKQGRHDELKKTLDVHVARQRANGRHRARLRSDKYSSFLHGFVVDFAKFIALLDREYIFAWLDWDGDNLLLDPGIIDYGSIRHMGLRHDEYRYDDVDRYSTNLNEQEKKAQLIVQTLAQATEFVASGKKPTFQKCAKHWALSLFHRELQNQKLQYFLQQLGFSSALATRIFQEKTSQVRNLYKSFYALETVKTRRKAQRVPDGVNRPAILNMRQAVRWLMDNPAEVVSKMSAQEFFKVSLAATARGKDKVLGPSLKKKIDRFLALYRHFTKTVAVPKNPAPGPARKTTRRLTGDAVLHVVERLMQLRRKPDKGYRLLQDTIDDLILQHSPERSVEDLPPSMVPPLVRRLLRLIDGHQESI